MVVGNIAFSKNITLAVKSAYFLYFLLISGLIFAYSAIVKFVQEKNMALKLEKDLNEIEKQKNLIKKRA